MFAPRDNQRDEDAARRDLQERRIARRLAALAATLGEDVREERRHRQLPLVQLAALSGLSVSTICGIEHGRLAAFDSYVRLADALRLQPEFALVEPRRRAGRQEDPVHAAMGEILARRLTRPGLDVRVDEPYQHYQFAGRGDIVAADVSARALIQTENRTRFPNLQEAIGSFNAKRAYLGGVMAERLGVARWESETHVIIALWSAEVLHQVRLHAATLRSVCPDPPDTLAAWWEGVSPPSGRQTAFVLFDPLEGRRSDRRRWVGLEEALRPGLKPRYRDYTDALEALREARSA